MCYNDSSRPPLPGSEVQVQSQTASSPPEDICKMTQQVSGRPGVRFGSTPISSLVYRLGENHLKQTDCSLRYWKGEETSHDTTVLYQGVEEARLYVQRGHEKRRTMKH